MVSSLLMRTSLRFVLRHRWQTILTITGIVLGVAIVVAVDLANSSARRAFALSLDSVTGSATHQLQGGSGGIGESIYVQLRRTLGLQASAPLVSDYVTINDHTFLLLGIDPVAEAALQRHRLKLQAGKGLDYMLQADTVVMSQRSAEKLQLGVGDSLKIDHRAKQHDVKLAGIFISNNPAATEGLVFADISVAQELLDRVGTLDRIDLHLTDAEIAGVKAWMPASLQLLNSETRNNSIRKMSEVFHINLTAMSLLALLVGGLLIHNTMTFSVLQRRGITGTLRTLGVTRREIFWLVMAEASLFGLIGTIIGGGAGILLGQELVHLVMRTVNDLYFVLHVSEFYISPLSLLKGVLLGMGVTWLAALLPALEAMKSPPLSVQQRSVLEQRWQARMPRLLFSGLVMFALGWLLIIIIPGHLLFGFIALTLVVFGFSLAVPFMMQGLAKFFLLLVSPFANNTARMIIRSIIATMSRTGLAVAALTVAVSATIGVGIMVDSFRHSVGIWLEQSLNGDVYVSLPGRSSVRASPGLPPGLVTSLRDLPGVAASSSTRVLKTATEYGPLNILAIDNSRRNARGFNLKYAVKNIHQAMEQGDGLLVSEPLANHQKLSIGDRIRINTDSGEVVLSILGIFYDYTSSQGMMIMERRLYNQLWQDRQVSGLTLYRHSSMTQAELLAAVTEQVKRYSGHIMVRSNREIRDISLDIFDQTFAITDVLRLLVILVAFIGILSALMSLQLERARELAILRASGMTPREIVFMVIAQTALMGVFAGILAIPLGLMMSTILIDVINLHSFGWSIQHILPLNVLLEAWFLSLGAAVLAGCYPAVRAARLSPSQALREE